MLTREYDVVLSFAGEDRPYVDRVAASLSSTGIRVFYDRYEEVELWGKDLYQHLSEVYRNYANYCVIFASRAYAHKLWPKHELASAQARALSENREYILPARFDDTEIPGILPTTGYVDLRHRTPEDLAAVIAKKVRPTQAFERNSPSRQGGPSVHGATSVYCHILGGEVSVVTSSSGKVTNVVCPHFWQLTHGCQLKQHSTGALMYLTGKIVDKLTGTRSAHCEFGEPTDNPTRRLSDHF